MTALIVLVEKLLRYTLIYGARDFNQLALASAPIVSGSMFQAGTGDLLGFLDPARPADRAFWKSMVAAATSAFRPVVTSRRGKASHHRVRAT